MDRRQARDMARSFLEAFGADARYDAQIRNLVEYRFGQAADLLPKPAAWTVVGRHDTARLLLLGPNALFTIACGKSPEHQVVISSQPVEIERVTYRREDRQTHWRFDLADGDPLIVEGEVDRPSAPGDDEIPGETERFARALASRAGWAERSL